MLDLAIWVYAGLALAIFGSLAMVIGPGVKDPIIRTINSEVASVGVCLILLSYNHIGSPHTHCNHCCNHIDSLESCLTPRGNRS